VGGVGGTKMVKEVKGKKLKVILNNCNRLVYLFKHFPYDEETFISTGPRKKTGIQIPCICKSYFWL